MSSRPACAGGSGAAVLVWLLLCVPVCAGTMLGCGGSRLAIPAGPMGSVAVDADTAIAFQQRAEVFYLRLIQRRFNTLETFNDRVLREHFRNPESFFDYYANLAESFSAAHFEKSRPVSVAIHEFVFDDPDRVRVQIEFVGEDDRPLRPNKVVLIRQDRWEQSAGNWWVAPGKL